MSSIGDTVIVPVTYEDGYSGVEKGIITSVDRGGGVFVDVYEDYIVVK